MNFRAIAKRSVGTPGVSNTFGMSWMLDDFVRRCSGLSKDDPHLIAAVVAAGSEFDTPRRERTGILESKT